jgi:Uma2 family endonuclease
VYGSIRKRTLGKPNLGKYKAEIDSFWSQEQRVRQELRETMLHQRYEFINGNLIEKIPNTADRNRVQGLLFQFLNVYVLKNQLGKAGVGKMMASLTRNDYEPTVCFWDKSVADKFGGSQLLFPVPDFVVEILSKSTEKRDRGIKFTDYVSHGVFEYWIIDPENATVQQYKLYKGEFQIYATFKAEEGTITSFAVQGFKIPVKAIFDEKVNLETLQQLLN